MVGLFASAETSATRIAVMGGSVTHTLWEESVKVRHPAQEQD